MAEEIVYSKDDEKLVVDDLNSENVNKSEPVLGRLKFEKVNNIEALPYHSNINPDVVFDSYQQAQGQISPDITTIEGKNSWVEGDSRDNIIRAINGYNMLAGNDGDDTIIGGKGFNEIYAGAGEDFVKGGDAGNYIWGDGLIGNVVMTQADSSNDDFIEGGSSDDEIFGGTYLDAINTAGSGDDYIDGGKGDDTIWGGDGDDTLVGGAGKDSFNYTLKSGTSFGNDEILDATKDDKIVINSRGTVTVDGVQKERWVATDTSLLSFYADGDDLVISTGTALDNTITLENFMKNKASNNLDTISFDNYAPVEGSPSDFSILRDAIINVESDDGVYNGTDYNESLTTDTGYEIITMGKGTNTINVSVDYGIIGEKIVNLTKGETLYINIPDSYFDNGVETDIDLSYFIEGNDLIVETGNLGEIRIVGAAKNNTGAEVFINDQNIDTITLLSYDAGDVTSKGTLTGTNFADNIQLLDYISPNGKGVKINSKAGNDIITGTYYNDTIKSASKTGEIDTVTEYGGVNKITTGKGNDVIYADGYSSNTIKAGAGKNTINLLSVGINKVTAGNDGNTLYVDKGFNTVKFGKGNNLLTIEDGINNIKTSSGLDKYSIFGGNNIINSGSGDDQYLICGGENTIKTGNAETIFTITTDIEEGLSEGRNSITSGKKVDTFNISAGDNFVNSGAGNDKFNITGGYSVLDGNKGDDVYSVDLTTADGFDFSQGGILISDTKGNNKLELTVDTGAKVNLFFDVEAEYNKKGVFKGAKYDSMVFTTEDDMTGLYNIGSIDGIDVINNKSVKTLTYGGQTYSISAKELDALAADIANWMDSKGYSSTAEVLAYGGADASTLVSAYTNFANNGYQYSAINSLAMAV